MRKMVMEVQEERTEVVRAMDEHLAALQRTGCRLGGGKAVDYAEIEQAMAESAGRTELAGHRAILQSLEIDVAAGMVGGVGYTRVGRCGAAHPTVGGELPGWVTLSPPIRAPWLGAPARGRGAREPVGGVCVG